MCSLLHVFGRTGVGARDIRVEKQKEQDLKTKGALLQAIRGRGRRGRRGEEFSSSDGDGGGAGGGSSNDDTGEGEGGLRDHKSLPPTQPKLPSSLMRALTIPPPSPLSMTLDEFTKDFLLKFPPAPKSYEVTAAQLPPSCVAAHDPCAGDHRQQSAPPEQAGLSPSFLGLPLMNPVFSHSEPLNANLHTFLFLLSGSSPGTRRRCCWWRGGAWRTGPAAAKRSG